MKISSDFPQAHCRHSLPLECIAESSVVVQSSRRELAVPRHEDSRAKRLQNGETYNQSHRRPECLFEKLAVTVLGLCTSKARISGWVVECIWVVRRYLLFQNHCSSRSHPCPSCSFSHSDDPSTCPHSISVYYKEWQTHPHGASVKTPLCTNDYELQGSLYLCVYLFIVK